MTNALVIAGHGSLNSPNTAAPAWRHADAIRAMGSFDEVTCAFWKEAPALHRVLDTLTADDVTIVPLFTSQGYFTKVVLPRELGLDAALTVRDGRTIRYTDPIGQHPHMTAVVKDRADAILDRYKLNPARTALALAGHGTRRDAESARATEHQAEAIRATGRFAEVVAIYIDEPPEIESVYRITSSPVVIVVPFFVADGPHTQHDIPNALHLGVEPGGSGYPVPAHVQGRDVYYTPAVGLEPSVVNVILDLAQAAGASLKTGAMASPWAGFPMVGIKALRKMQGPFQFGQAMVEPYADGYRIRHASDPLPNQLLNNPPTLRNFLNYTANEEFRALRTSRDMPRGWFVQVESPEAVLAVLETIYPTAWVDYALHGEGFLSVQTLAQVTGRQTGMYRRLEHLSTASIQELTASVCAACVRNPVWAQGDIPESGLPCPEACQHWMNAALQHLESLRV
jgi:sirohydrochlorin cobaltochelatase